MDCFLPFACSDFIYNELMPKGHLLVLFFLLVPLTSSAESYDELFERILKTHKLSKEHAGWMVYNLDTKENLGGWKQQLPFIPASLSKLVTASAVLNLLPKELAFKTEILLDTQAPKTEHKGNLYIRGGGDPAFTSESLWALVNEFVRSGVKKIEGSIWVDDTRFQDAYISETRQDGRVRRAYDAPVGALSFNWNSVNVYVRPAQRAGEPAVVHLDPPSEYLSLVNQTKTGTSKSKENISISLRAEKGKEVVVVQGTFPAGQQEKVYYRSIRDPALWTGYQLKSFLSQRGIVVTGSVQKGKTPSGAHLHASHEGKTLPLLVYDMQKWSNNYVAEMLVKNLSAELGGPGTLLDGMSRARTYLATLPGWEKDSFVFVNPSGLTRDNQFTPQQLISLLSSTKDDFSSFAEFLFALPVAGTDGTLRNRMVQNKSKVRAKTGMLNGVVGLAGYVPGPNQQLLSFVFIYNGPSTYPKVWSAFDAMAGQLSR